MTEIFDDLVRRATERLLRAVDILVGAHGSSGADYGCDLVKLAADELVVALSQWQPSLVPTSDLELDEALRAIAHRAGEAARAATDAAFTIQELLAEVHQSTYDAGDGIRKSSFAPPDLEQLRDDLDSIVDSLAKRPTR